MKIRNTYVTPKRRVRERFDDSSETMLPLFYVDKKKKRKKEERRKKKNEEIKKKR